MRIQHPETGQVADVTDEAYELVYSTLRWEPVPEEEPTPRPSVDPLPDVGAMTIAEVHAFLDANPHRVADVLEVELGGKNRKTLVGELQERAGTAAADPTPVPANEAPTDPADEADNTPTEEPTS